MRAVPAKDRSSWRPGQVDSPGRATRLCSGVGQSSCSAQGRLHPPRGAPLGSPGHSQDSSRGRKRRGLRRAGTSGVPSALALPGAAPGAAEATREHLGTTGFIPRNGTEGAERVTSGFIPGPRCPQHWDSGNRTRHHGIHPSTKLSPGLGQREQNVSPRASSLGQAVPTTGSRMCHYGLHPSTKLSPALGQRQQNVSCSQLGQEQSVGHRRDPQHFQQGWGDPVDNPDPRSSEEPQELWAFPWQTEPHVSPAVPPALGTALRAHQVLFLEHQGTPWTDPTAAEPCSPKSARGPFQTHPGSAEPWGGAPLCC